MRQTKEVGKDLATEGHILVNFARRHERTVPGEQSGQKQRTKDSVARHALHGTAELLPYARLMVGVR